MELRIKKWIPVIEEQAKSGMSKEQWCGWQYASLALRRNVIFSIYLQNL